MTNTNLINNLGMPEGQTRVFFMTGQAGLVPEDRRLSLAKLFAENPSISDTFYQEVGSITVVTPRSIMKTLETFPALVAALPKDKRNRVLRKSRLYRDTLMIGDIVAPPQGEPLVLTAKGFKPIAEL